MANLKDKIANTQDEIRQLQNRLKEYEQRQKEQERKARDHRVFQRGGYLEKVLPGTIALTEENFRTWFDLAIANDTTRDLLSEVIAEQEKQVAADGADANPNGDEQPAEKPAAAPPQTVSPASNVPPKPHQQGAATATSKPPEAARTAG